MRYASRAGLALGLLAIVASALSAQSNGRENGEPIVVGTRTSIRSAILDEDRPVLVHTPPGYEQSADSFPVLYLLDGDGHFLHTTGVTQGLASNSRMPAMIVVGVPNLSQDGRTRDLTPPITGPRHRQRVLCRRRRQQFFAAQALIEKPLAFEAYISISPSLWWDEGNLRCESGLGLRAEPGPEGRMVHDHGQRGRRHAGGRVHDGRYPGDESPALVPLEVDPHAGRGPRLGSAPQPLRRTGVGLRRMDPSRRLRHRHGRGERPGSASANVYDSLGDACDAACRWTEARDMYATAYRMAEAVSHPNTGTYRAKLDRISATMESGAKCELVGLARQAPRNVAGERPKYSWNARENWLRLAKPTRLATVSMDGGGSPRNSLVPCVVSALSSVAAILEHGQRGGLQDS